MLRADEMTCKYRSRIDRIDAYAIDHASIGQRLCQIEQGAVDGATDGEIRATRATAYPRDALDHFSYYSVRCYSRQRLNKTVLASGVCCYFLGDRRIGKRVKLPHGPATVKAF